MQLKGSKIEQHLKDAFAGESQANRRYLYFAAKSDIEGHNDVAALFRSTADGETGHAHVHLEYLEQCGDPATGLPFGPTIGKLKTDFRQPLGKVAYHAACHQRVQNIVQKTREALSLIPDTPVEIIERCSGHDGTYAVKKEFHAYAMKIVTPVVERVKNAEAAHYGSDCAMAGHHIENGPQGRMSTGTSDYPVAQGLWHLKFSGKNKPQPSGEMQ